MEGPDEQVVLVDERDRAIGVADKLAVHRDGRRHRALSVFVFDDRGRLLLQRRAAAKYHSAGQWSNTCCGHPRSGEPIDVAARRRLRDEMGLDCALERAVVVSYRVELRGGLIEHEIDHVFVGRSSARPLPDPSEVDAWRYADEAEIEAELRVDPERFAPWFPLVLRALRGAPGAECGG